MVQTGRRIVWTLLLVTLVGALALNSAPPPGDEGRGVVAAIRSALSLGYQLPTEPTSGIKALVLRGGVTAMAVVAMIAGGLSIRRRPEPGGRGQRDRRPDAERAALLGDCVDESPGWTGQWTGPRWALLLSLAWLAWAVLASRWSHAPREAVGYAGHFLFLVTLAAVVACVLDRRMVQRTARVWLAVLALATVLVLASGDTDTTAAPLLAGRGELLGLLLAGGVLAGVKLAGGVAEMRYPDDSPTRGAVGRWFWRTLFCLAVVVLIVWLASRGDGLRFVLFAMASVAGVATAGILLTRRLWRAGWVAGGIVATGSLLFMWGAADALPSLGPKTLPMFMGDQPFPHDRGQALVASELITQRPIVGHGGWGGRLLADDVAAQCSASNPRWTGRTFRSLGSFWREQWVDLGAVGLTLLAGALLAVVLSAGRAIRRCPWRPHRYLTAALAGGLVAMAVWEFFDDSLCGEAFAATFAAWAGLTLASARWATRPLPEPGHNEYVLGFYRGGIFFLTGAAVVLATVGYIVVEDWRAGRAIAQVAQTDLPAARAAGGQIERYLASDPLAARRPASRFAFATQSNIRNDAMAAAMARLQRATRWSIDPGPRLAALAQRADLELELATWHADEQSAALRAGADPVPLAVTAAWADALIAAAAARLERDRIRPIGPAGSAQWLATMHLMIARIRGLSYWPTTGPDHADRNAILLRQMAQQTAAARARLDARLAVNPHDLPVALLRESLADRQLLADRLGAPPVAANWLWAEAKVELSPAQRLRLLRDAIRDFGAVWAEPIGWSLVIAPPGWENLALPLNRALVRMERDLPLAADAWKTMLDDADSTYADCMSGRAERQETPEADMLDPSQTYRLAAELAMVRHEGRARAGATTPPALAHDELADADRWLEKAGGRSAMQRVIVALQRAQLAWYRGDERGVMLNLIDADSAVQAVPPGPRRSAAEAIAVVRAFVLAEQGQFQQAGEWFAPVSARKWMDLSRMHRELRTAWRGWLSPPPSPAPTSQPGGPLRLRWPALPGLD